MRARLARSARPNRIFERTLEVAKAAGLVGVRRVLDSTPLYDAVATMDTVSLVRSAIRGVLAVAGDREPVLRSVLRRGDDYRAGGKPAIDWEDPDARAALVAALARDGEAVLSVLAGEPLSPSLTEAATLLATVLGQDLEDGPDGRTRIARRVARDRVISTVDPDARHGHKTNARGFDGYKGHVALDPDAELVTATAVTPGSAGDGMVATDLLADELAAAADPDAEPLRVYGDSAYGAGEVLAALADARAVSLVKVQPSGGIPGHFSKDDFTIDLAARTVTCPAGRVARFQGIRSVRADFGRACAACPLVERCTTSPHGRRIDINPHETLLAAGRAATRDPAWRADYRATRPKVERSSPISCADATAGDGPGSGAGSRSGPTSPSWPPRSTSRGSRSCALPGQAGAGWRSDPDPEAGEGVRASLKRHPNFDRSTSDPDPAPIEARTLPPAGQNPRFTPWCETRVLTGWQEARSQLRSTGRRARTDG